MSSGFTFRPTPNGDQSPRVRSAHAHFIGLFDLKSWDDEKVAEEMNAALVNAGFRPKFIARLLYNLTAMSAWLTSRDSRLYVRWRDHELREVKLRLYASFDRDICAAGRAALAGLEDPEVIRHVTAFLDKNLDRIFRLHDLSNEFFSIDLPRRRRGVNVEVRGLLADLERAIEAQGTALRGGRTRAPEPAGDAAPEEEDSGAAAAAALTPPPFDARIFVDDPARLTNHPDPAGVERRARDLHAEVHAAAAGLGEILTRVPDTQDPDWTGLAAATAPDAAWIATCFRATAQRRAHAHATLITLDGPREQIEILAEWTGAERAALARRPPDQALLVALERVEIVIQSARVALGLRADHEIFTLECLHLVDLTLVEHLRARLAGAPIREWQGALAATLGKLAGTTPAAK